MADEKEDKKTELFVLKIIIFVILIFVIYFVGKYFLWGFMVETFGPLYSYAGEAFGETKGVLSGEKEILSLESEVEIKEKSGIELSNLKPYGLEFGEFGEEFGTSVDVIINKFDERIKEIPAFASCDLYSDGDKRSGTIESDHKIGENNFKIKNPKEGEDKIKIDCVFKKDEAIKKGTIKFDFTYSIPFETYLDVFVLNVGYEDYFGSDLAFKELDDGIYKDYKSEIPSKMKYESDVEAKINFEDQPLTINKEINKEYTLGFQFKNKDIKNKVDIKNFEIKLPSGMELRTCKWLDGSGKLAGTYFKMINNQLNSDDGETDPLKCKVSINEKILGGSSGEIVKTDSIIGTLEYNYVLKKNIDIEID